MRTSSPVMIPVFVFTEEELALEKLELSTETAGFTETAVRAFYSIDSVYVFDDEKVYTAFYSGGTSFVTPMSMEEVIELIDNHNK